MTLSKRSRRRRRTRGDAVQAIDERFVAEQLVDVRPDIAESADHARARLVGAAREAQHPLDRVVAVVVDLLDRLLGDRGEGRVARETQRRVELEHVRRDDELPGDRVGEVAVGLLDDPRAAELGLVAEVGEIVLAAPVGRARVVQERARVAEQIECDVAERDVLLELGRAGDPPAQLLRQDERVVAQPQRVLRDIRRRDGVACRR